MGVMCLMSAPVDQVTLAETSVVVGARTLPVLPFTSHTQAFVLVL